MLNMRTHARTMMHACIKILFCINLTELSLESILIREWELTGKTNLAAYYTKNHPILHHKKMRPTYNLDGEPNP